MGGIEYSADTRALIAKRTPAETAEAKAWSDDAHARIRAGEVSGSHDLMRDKVGSAYAHICTNPPTDAAAASRPISVLMWLRDNAEITADRSNASAMGAAPRLLGIPRQHAGGNMIRQFQRDEIARIMGVPSECIELTDAQFHAYLWGKRWSPRWCWNVLKYRICERGRNDL